MTGIKLIAKERTEQIHKHGRTIERDLLENQHTQLLFASRVMLKNSPQSFFENEVPIGWSPEIWDHMLSKSLKERMIIAGALIAAELDRMNAIEGIIELSNLNYDKHPRVGDYGLASRYSDEDPTDPWYVGQLDEVGEDHKGYYFIIHDSTQKKFRHFRKLTSCEGVEILNKRRTKND